MSDEETRTDLDAADLVTRAHRYYRSCRDHTSEWRIEARTMYDMAAGRQWDAADEKTMADQDRPTVVFNRIARTLNAILGTQVANRQETSFLPREQGDVQKDEILTAASEWVREQCYAEDEESDAFEDMCVTGMGWTITKMDYSTDPEGVAIIERVDPLKMFWDPAATKRNLSDRRWNMFMDDMDKTEFAQRWPKADIGMASAPWDGRDDDTTQRHHVYPQDAYKEEQTASQGERSKGRVRVAQLQYTVKETVYRVGPDAETISEKAFKKLKKQLEANNVQYVKQQATRWRQCFIAGNAELEDEECPYPEGPTFRAMTYKRDRNKNTWFGIVKAMCDPQKFGNKFFSQILDILNKGAKGGIMAEKSAVDDPRELEEKWARPDGVVWFKSGALSGGKVIPKPVVTLPAGLDRLMTFSMDGVHEVTGINLELLGMANREQAGVLESQRKQAGVTIIAPLFDGLRRYRKEQGRVLLYFIQTYLSDGRLIRIVSKDQEQYVPLIKQPGVAKYDVIVDESPTSPNMKERVFGALSEMLPNMVKMGIPMPPELLDYAPIPSSLAAKWKELIQKSGGNPEQMQQQMQELQKQLQQMGQENQQLKSKKDEAMAQLQLDGQKQQAELQFERDKLTAELEIERTRAQADIDLQREKAAGQIQLEREKAGVQLQLEQQKLGAQSQLEQQKVDHGIALDRHKVEADTYTQTSHHKDVIANVIGENFKKNEKKRKFSVVRDKNGDVSGLQEG